MNDEMKPTDVALYKMCREVWLQYQAQHIHTFSPQLSKWHETVESYLKMTVDECDDEVIVTFVLNRSDIDA